MRYLEMNKQFGHKENVLDYLNPWSKFSFAKNVLTALLFSSRVQ